MGRKPAKTGSTVLKIAKEAGVSVATVSRVFNKSDLVRPDVAERILKLAEARNFTPRQASKRDTLVLVIENGSEKTFKSYAATMIKEVVQLCAERRLRLDIVSAKDIGLIRGKYVLGAISLLWEPESLCLFERISQTSLVAINAETKVPSVCADESHGMGLAIEYLKERGHSRIGLIARDKPSYGDRERLRYFDRIMSKMQGAGTRTRVSPFKIIFDATANGLMAELVKMFPRTNSQAQENRPTALIATGEDTGIMLMHHLQLLGIRVPQDVSVISHEAPELSLFFTPPHTTITQDYRGIINAAFDTFLSNRKSRKTKNLLIPYQFIERESVLSIKRK